MPLSEQDGFEHGQQGIGGTAAVVSDVTGSLTIQVLLNRLPINDLIQLQQWEAVDVFGNHGLGGLPEEGAHEKSPKCLDGNLGDFGEFCKGLYLYCLRLRRLVLIFVNPLYCDEKQKKPSEKPNLGFQTTFSFAALPFIR